MESPSYDLFPPALLDNPLKVSTERRGSINKTKTPTPLNSSGWSGVRYPSHAEKWYSGQTLSLTKSQGILPWEPFLASHQNKPFYSTSCSKDLIRAVHTPYGASENEGFFHFRDRGCMIDSKERTSENICLNIRKFFFH